MQKKKTHNLHLKKGDSLVPGVSVHDNEWQFYCVSDCRHSLVLCLYENTGQLYAQIDMLPFKIAGNVYSVRITGLEEKDLEYAYEADGRPCCDPYKKKSAGHRKWGEFDIDGENIRSGFYRDEFDWGDDVPLKLPYNQIIAYSMHVRGFTKHSSSGVKAKGTYLGIIEKIQYLKELGINQIELLPIYEFYELDVEKELLPEGHPKYLKDRKEPPEAKINYWGFKYGSYYVPKASYAYGEDSTAEFKTLVKELHKNGIEIILQFYFPNEINRTVILDCLKFWTINYHVDGFHIMGEHLPIDFIASDPLLTDTKLYYAYYDKEHIFLGKYEHNHFLAEVNQEYMNDMRRFLKSDEDMLQAFLYRQRRNPQDVHVINYLTAYEGFTLNDLVSYDYKHNEENGEENRDGNNYNYSWNCGAEGSTRRKAVGKLRMRQMKNAFAMLLLSQGTPMLLSGDEFCNTQYGNNNAYCQDNKVTWLNWKQTKQSQELYEYVKELIALRKSHPILHMEEELRIMDYAACGYPDLSYHAEAAWYPKMENHIRHIGMMLCGMYARIDRLTKDSFFFIAYNMHWESHKFGLPKLPKEMNWHYCLDTTDTLNRETVIKNLESKQDEITVPERSVLVLIGY